VWKGEAELMVVLVKGVDVMVMGKGVDAMVMCEMMFLKL
jgi:hypothetical protein